MVYSHQEEIWNTLILPENERDVRNYFADIHLDLIIDKSEGYAYLKQQQTSADEGENEQETPMKLIRRRALTFHVSLLCLLLRKHLIENDQTGESTRAILSREEINSQMKLYMKESTNEAVINKQIDAAIKKVEGEGFLRRMKTEQEQYEVNRIIKAFVNADQVSEWWNVIKNT
ncbi:DUF4194 domain-containing protein [uncultured Parabacteroides sp.]|uniref:DUF4194 domain-containing protein n=1 Tax=uncultured Parabacteroides sp. TaxID=512312 RepID=UPI00259BE5E1|nr:DUF4194 domain-containing protein [uncultured Parabacteroides sp.]